MLNNPTNMQRTDPLIPWLGLAVPQTDVRFLKFIDPAYGYRAAMKALRTHAERTILQGNIFCITTAITVWAPPNKPGAPQDNNNTRAYIENVALWSQIRPAAPLDVTDMEMMMALLTAITRQEQGRVIYPADLIQHGLSMLEGWRVTPAQEMV
jgi:hypothetical protein